MQMYVNYYDRKVKLEERPPKGDRMKLSYKKLCVILGKC